MVLLGLLVSVESGQGYPHHIFKGGAVAVRLGHDTQAVEAAGQIAGQGAGVAAWLTARGRGEPASVLGAWHVPVSGEELAEFARAFPALRYEVRGPTLDDLFMKLALTP